VDASGPRAPVGGGAMSGKDFYKADRAGAIVARRPRRHGHPRLLPRPRAGPRGRPARRGRPGARRSPWAALVDLSLAGARDRWTGRADRADVARRGHFTRPDRPWEAVHFDGKGAG
jgi:hypothetical protein